MWLYIKFSGKSNPTKVNEFHCYKNYCTVILVKGLVVAPFEKQGVCSANDCHLKKTTRIRNHSQQGMPCEYHLK